MFWNKLKETIIFVSARDGTGHGCSFLIILQDLSGQHEIKMDTEDHACLMFMNFPPPPPLLSSNTDGASTSISYPSFFLLLEWQAEALPILARERWGGGGGGGG